MIKTLLSLLSAIWRQKYKFVVTFSDPSGYDVVCDEKPNEISLHFISVNVQVLNQALETLAVLTIFNLYMNTDKDISNRTVHIYMYRVWNRCYTLSPLLLMPSHLQSYFSYVHQCHWIHSSIFTEVVKGTACKSPLLNEKERSFVCWDYFI